MNAPVPSAVTTRIPFAAAVSHPALLEKRFLELSFAQRAVLKAAYGMPLDDAQRDSWQWTEYEYFLALSGHAEFDALGFIERVRRAEAPPYIPQEYTEIVLNQGVRGGKSTLASFIVTYEATCGGHESRVRAGRKWATFQIAQDLALAKYSLNDIVANLDMMPAMQSGGPFKDGKRYDATKERIDLWHGGVIMTVPPTIKSIRGYDSPAGVLDEVAVWYQDSDSANPDFEVYSQVRSRQATFINPKIWLISSPWNEGGLLYERVKAGTNGCYVRCDEHLMAAPASPCAACLAEQSAHSGRLVLSMPTAAMGNPLVTRQWLESYKRSNPRAFERECLARFQKSVSGFLEAEIVEGAVARGVRERAPLRGVQYVIAIDPAFRRDIFAVAVAHTDDRGRVVFDRIERWRRKPGEPPLNVEERLDAVAEIAQLYGVSVLWSDQYQHESLKVLCSQRGLGLAEVNFQAGSKAEIYSNLHALLNQRKLVLLDRQDVVDELTRLERTLTPGGAVHIEAPRGHTDDLATVTALAAKQAVWLTPVGAAQTEDGAFLASYAHGDKELSVQERIQAQIAQRHYVATAEWD
jgi:hypothetical protein